MSLFIRDDIPVRQLGERYKYNMRRAAMQRCWRMCERWVIGWNRWMPYQITKDFVHMYMKGA